MMTAFERMRAWRDDLAAQANARGEKMFLNKPDAWFADPHFMCENGHVSGMILTGDSGDRCLECHKPTILGPAIGEARFAPIAAAFRRLAEQEAETPNG